MARSSPSVPDRKMNGMSGASSWAISSAEMPSKPGSVKSDRIRSGLLSCRVRRRTGSESTRFEVPDRDLGLGRHVFHQYQFDRLHVVVPAADGPGAPYAPAPATLRIPRDGTCPPTAAQMRKIFLLVPAPCDPLRRQVLQ